MSRYLSFFFFARRSSRCFLFYCPFTYRSTRYPTYLPLQYLVHESHWHSLCPSSFLVSTFQITIRLFAPHQYPFNVESFCLSICIVIQFCIYVYLMHFTYRYWFLNCSVQYTLYRWWGGGKGEGLVVWSTYTLYHSHTPWWGQIHYKGHCKG